MTNDERNAEIAALKAEIARIEEAQSLRAQIARLEATKTVTRTTVRAVVRNRTNKARWVW
jgi:hypothetical protein